MKAKPEHAGIMRNDLPGFMKLRGNKIYIRYKGKDISTGYNNTAFGWKSANTFWEKKSRELQAIESGEKAHEDSILNVFKKFLNYKKRITKIAKATEEFYLNCFKSVFVNPNEILSESNIKKQLSNFVETAEVSGTTINNYLRGVNTFLLWLPMMTTAIFQSKTTQKN